MDALFRDKGNVNPFGILDTGLGSQDGDYSENDSDGDLTDGHDHSRGPLAGPLPDVQIYNAQRLSPSPDAPSIGKGHGPTKENTAGTPEALTKHYRSFLDNEFSSPPPTPKGRDETRDDPSPVLQPIDPSPVLQPVLSESADLGNMVKSSSHAKQPGKETKKRSAKKYALTAAERALDSSSDDEPNAVPLTQTQSAAKSTSHPKHSGKQTKKRSGQYALTAEERALDSSSNDEPDAVPLTKTQSAARSASQNVRAPLSRRGLDPLPSIDPSNVHVKDHKHALASAIQQANDAKMEVFAKAQHSREQLDQARLKLDEARIQADLEDRKSTLSWTKEHYFLNREEQREIDSRRLAEETRKERKAFCEQMVLEGKTPQELEAYLRLIYPAEENGHAI